MLMLLIASDMDLYLGTALTARLTHQKGDSREWGLAEGTVEWGCPSEDQFRNRVGVGVNLMAVGQNYDRRRWAHGGCRKRLRGLVRQDVVRKGRDLSSAGEVIEVMRSALIPRDEEGSGSVRNEPCAATEQRA